MTEFLIAFNDERVPDYAEEQMAERSEAVKALRSERLSRVQRRCVEWHEARRWAGKIAVACGWPQEVRRFRVATPRPEHWARGPLRRCACALQSRRGVETLVGHPTWLRGLPHRTWCLGGAVVAQLHIDAPAASTTLFLSTSGYWLGLRCCCATAASELCC